MNRSERLDEGAHTAPAVPRADYQRIGRKLANALEQFGFGFYVMEHPGGTQQGPFLRYDDAVRCWRQAVERGGGAGATYVLSATRLLRAAIGRSEVQVAVDALPLVDRALS